MQLKLFGDYDMNTENQAMLRKLQELEGIPFLGFTKDMECYYREGCITYGDIGSLLIALIDTPAETLYKEAEGMDIDLEVATTPELGKESAINAYASVAKRYINVHSVLSSFHELLADRVVDSFKKDSFSLAFYEEDGVFHREEYLRVADYIEKHIFNGKEKYDNFSDDGVKALFRDENIVFTNEFKLFMEWFVARLSELLKILCELKTSLSLLVPEILVRNESGILPAARYDRWNTRKQRTDESDDIKEFRAAADLEATYVFGLMRKETFSEYDETSGLRWVCFYDARLLAPLAYLELQYMSTNNIEISACKSCGRYFWAPTRAVRFCDRQLDDNTDQTCRSTSAQWYVENRRSNNPAYQEYTLYKNRYRMRMKRSRTKNPYERFVKWDKEAQSLMQKFENGTISFDTFKEKIDEMDKDMKPLDKM